MSADNMYRAWIDGRDEYFGNYHLTPEADCFGLGLTSDSDDTEANTDFDDGPYEYQYGYFFVDYCKHDIPDTDVCYKCDMEATEINTPPSPVKDKPYTPSRRERRRQDTIRCHQRHIRDLALKAKRLPGHFVPSADDEGVVMDEVPAYVPVDNTERPWKNYRGRGCSLNKSQRSMPYREHSELTFQLRQAAVDMAPVTYDEDGFPV